MQATSRTVLRIAQNSSHRLATIPRRNLATTLAAETTTSSSASSSTVHAQKSAPLPLGNVEAQWEILSQEEKHSVQVQLEELAKKDWKTLSIDEKKAAYYVAFGPHGPRAPASKPGENLKVFLGTLALIGIAGALHLSIRAIAPEAPKTINKEWEEAMNERAIEQKANPITGITSEGYSGKGFVTQK